MQAGEWSQTLENSVINLIQKHGITVVVATGNSQIDACMITPANVNGTIAVAGSDASNKFNSPEPGDKEMMYEFDNTGKCVDVFAPGVDILAACGGAGKHCCMIGLLHTLSQELHHLAPDVSQSSLSIGVCCKHAKQQSMLFA